MKNQVRSVWMNSRARQTVLTEKDSGGDPGRPLPSSWKSARDARRRRRWRLAAPLAILVFFHFRLALREGDHVVRPHSCPTGVPSLTFRTERGSEGCHAPARCMWTPPCIMPAQREGEEARHSHRRPLRSIHQDLGLPMMVEIQSDSSTSNSSTDRTGEGQRT